jgi:TonB-linked SusC/RagA family outer membrane protein
MEGAVTRAFQHPPSKEVFSRRPARPAGTTSAIFDADSDVALSASFTPGSRGPIVSEVGIALGNQMMHWDIRWQLVLAMSVATLPALSAAQQSGTITGRVVNGVTQAPIVDAQVGIVGTSRGVRTGEDGRYRIPSVSTGRISLRVTRISFESQTQQVTVTANGTATADFALSVSITALDAIVVSATGETQRKRESGVSIGMIDTSMLNLATVPNFSSILSSRTAGVTVQQSGGTTGTGSRIRIRGSNSISLSNDPLLIVDGVRLNNSTAAFSIGLGGQTTSRFDDINPDDIENIEIIKGPAASALYGTAAANGVIQVTTKRGSAGKTKWNSFAEYGTLNNETVFPANFAVIGVTTAAVPARTTTCTLEKQVQQSCIPKVDSIAQWNPLMNVSPFTTGQRSMVGLNASGGSDVVTYYLGGDLEREQGVASPNLLKRVNLRANVRAQLRPTVDATMTVGYLTGRTDLPFNDNTSFGPIGAGLLGKAFDCSRTTFTTTPSCGIDSLGRGYFNANVPATDIYKLTNESNIDHLTIGLNSNWQALSWLRGVGQTGVDVIQRYDFQLEPPNLINTSALDLLGSKFGGRTTIPTYTANGSGIATFQLTPVLQSSTSLGGSFTREEFHSTTASGVGLLAGTAGLGTTSSQFSVGETNNEVVTLGVFGQEQLAWNDRLFLTASLRGDQSSTFGSAAGKIYYPSASASWVISEQPGFPTIGFLNQLRLRTAYGKSGQRPSFRQGNTTLSGVSTPINGVEVSSITVGTTGNSLLKPETSTEFEGGFEASMFNSRLGLDLTAYTKKTQDALINVTLPGSLGVTTTAPKNLGQVSNSGYEAQANLTIIDTHALNIQATMTASRTHNLVVDVGRDATGNTLPPITIGFNGVGQHRDGYPLGSFFQRKILSFKDLNADGIISRVNCPAYGGTANPQLVGGPKCEIVLSDSAEYLGAPIPSREATFSPTATLFQRVKFAALIDYRGGFTQYNFTRQFRCATIQNCQDINDKTTPLADQAKAIAALMGTATGYIEDASYTKLRELSATVTLPPAWARHVGGGNLSLTVAGRNLKTWTKYTGFDPEVNSNNGNNFNTADFLAQPPVRYFTTRITVTY